MKRRDFLKNVLIVSSAPVLATLPAEASVSPTVPTALTSEPPYLPPTGGLNDQMRRIAQRISSLIKELPKVTKNCEP